MPYRNVDSNDYWSYDPRVAVRILDVEGFEVDGPGEAAEDRDGADVSDHRNLAA
jgi:hypothetical protein